MSLQHDPLCLATTWATLHIILKALTNERKNSLPGYFLWHGIMGTWNDIGGCYMNQKHSETPFCTLLQTYFF